MEIEAIIAKALLDGNVPADAPDALARQILDALDRAGFTVKRKPKPRVSTPEIVEPFNPSTGDPALDEFMRAHHDPKYKPAPLPKGAPFPGTAPRPLAKVLEEAIDAAKRNGWPGTYSGNFAAPKRGQR